MAHTGVIRNSFDASVDGYFVDPYLRGFAHRFYAGDCMSNLRCATAGFLLLILTGCATTAIKKDTISHGVTANQILYEVILANLEMARKEPTALPWHVKITSGNVSIDDTINPSFTFAWPSIARSLELSATRDWNFSWTIVPETDADNLLALQNVYVQAAQATNFSTNYDEGDKPLPGRPSGSYNGHFVSVKPEGMQAFGDLVIGVLRGAPVKDSERALQVYSTRTR